MAGGSEQADGDIGFQIAPMIDLILVLLVFFMSTVALKQVENELGINLPGRGLGYTDANITVEMSIGIDADGSVNLNNESLGGPEDRELQKLRAKLAEQITLFNNKVPVIIAPQANVPHRRVIDVLNACSAAGIKNISFGGS